VGGDDKNMSYIHWIIVCSSFANLTLLILSTKVVLGYRALPIINANPQWYVLKLLDGFGSHVNCYEVNLICSEHKVINLKEKVDSSHVNQAYDLLIATAKSDKAAARESLVWLQRNNVENAAHLDQWDLVHAGLAAIWRSRKNALIWENLPIQGHPHAWRFWSL
jgi:hypothetical protein